MKKLAILFALLLAACTLLSACGSGDTEPVDKPTDEEIISLLKNEADLYRYLYCGAMVTGGTAGTPEYPEKKFYKCAEEDKDEWSEWESYVKSIYCGDELIGLALGSASIVNIDGYTYSDGAGGRGYDLTDDFTIFCDMFDREKSIAYYSVNNPYVSEEDGVKTTAYTFKLTDDGWRIESKNG